MPISTDGTAPYAPPATILQVINAYRDRGLSVPITVDVLLRASVTGSLAPRVLASMKVLELLDKDGKPTPELEGLRRATTDEFRQRLEAIVRSVYAEVFKFVDPATDPLQKIVDAFRAYNPAAQRTRMVTLFTGLCEAAGIIPEGTTRKQASVATVKKPAKVAAKPVVAKYGSDSGAGREAATPSLAGVDPLLATVLQKLPPNGTGWTTGERERWLTFFTTTLDFTVPIRDGAANANTDVGDDDDDE